MFPGQYLSRLEEPSCRDLAIRGLFRGLGRATEYEQLFNKRYTATQAAARYTYVLTEIEEEKDKGAGLVGLNLNSGEVEHQVLLKMKEPDYDVDELEGRIFNVKDKKEITAYSVR